MTQLSILKHGIIRFRAVRHGRKRRTFYLRGKLKMLVLLDLGSQHQGFLCCASVMRPNDVLACAPVKQSLFGTNSPRSAYRVRIFTTIPHVLAFSAPYSPFGRAQNAHGRRLGHERARIEPGSCESDTPYQQQWKT